MHYALTTIYILPSMIGTTLELGSWGLAFGWPLYDLDMRSG